MSAPRSPDPLPLRRRRRCRRATLTYSCALLDVIGVGILVTCFAFATCDAKQGEIKHQGGIVLEDEEPNFAQGFIAEKGVDIKLEEPNIELVEVTVAEDPLPKMYQSVPVKALEEKLRKVTSAYDIIQISYETKLSHEDIDRIMEEGIKAARVPYGQSARPSFQDVRPQKTPWKESKAGSHDHLNSLQSDQPVNLDHHIHYTYQNFTPPRRRPRRHHGRKQHHEEPDDDTIFGPQHHHQKSGPVSTELNSSGGQVPVQRASTASEQSASPIEALDAVIRHINENQLHKCQPVPVYVPILTKKRPVNMVYMPDCTIVHRCRADASCCPLRKTCQYAARENITKPFLEYELTSDRKSVFPNSGKTVNFTFVNHTECYCKALPTIPKCKPCPKPFILKPHSNESSECICVCDKVHKDHKDYKDYKKCNKMKRGKIELDDVYIRCIKNGTCELPACRYGNLTDELLSAGHCPERPLRSPRSNTFSRRITSPRPLNKHITQSRLEQRIPSRPHSKRRRKTRRDSKRRRKA